MIRDGKNATTNLSGFRKLVVVKPGHARSYYNGDKSQWYETWGNILTASVVDPQPYNWDDFEVVNSQAVGKFVTKCVEAQRSFQGSTFIGELAETLEMIRHPAKALRNAIWEHAVASKVKHAKFKKRKDKQKWLSGSWLEFQFGVQPLLGDIQSAIDALTDYDPNPKVRVRASARKQSSTYSTATLNGAGVVDGDFSFENKFETSVRYMGSVYATPPYLDGLEYLSTYGFDPVRDFVPTVYELIPYSFLVDYFTNIGEILQAWCFWKGNLSWYCRTFKLHSSKTSVNHGYHRTGHTFDPVTPERAYASSEWVQRDVPDTLVPSFTFEVPGTGSLKWLNIAALANEARALIFKT